MLRETTTGKSRGVSDISFHCDDDAVELSDWLLGYLNSELENGKSFGPGETISTGGTLLRVVSVEDQRLELFEPGFDSMPIKWIRGVNTTLRHSALQTYVCSSIGSQPEFASILQAAVISPNFRGCESLIMSRDAPNGNDTGWVLREDAYEGQEGEFMSLYQAALYQDRIIPFFALPPGRTVRLTRSSIELEFRGNVISSNSNDLLKSLLHSEVMI
jgi:hypothetical protein